MPLKAIFSKSAFCQVERRYRQHHQGMGREPLNTLSLRIHFCPSDTYRGLVSFSDSQLTLSWHHYLIVQPRAGSCATPLLLPNQFSRVFYWVLHNLESHHHHSHNNTQHGFISMRG